MDGWVDGQMDGWMNEWIDGWVDKCLMDQTTNGVFFFQIVIIIIIIIIIIFDSGYHDNMYKDNIVPKCWYYLQKVPLLILKLLVVDLSLLN